MLAFIALAMPFARARAAVHPSGANIKTQDGTIYFIGADGQKRPYTSAGAFLSYGLNAFNNVVDASAEDNALPSGSFIPPQDGKIICSDRGGDKGTCYLISQSVKVGFPTAAIFTGQGFNFKNALRGDTSFLAYNSNTQTESEAHRPGVLVNKGGTIYLVGSQGLLGIPSVQTFQSWGYSFNDVVLANSADKALPTSGIMPTHSAGLLSPLGQNLSSSPSPATNPSPMPTPNLTPSPAAQIVYAVNTTTPQGTVEITVDSASPSAQQLPMSKKGAVFYAVNFKETSGNEAVNIKGLTITARVTGGITNGNGVANTAYNTLKNLSLVNGSTVISRASFSASTPPREGAGTQTYEIDFKTGSPLNFQIPASGTVTLTLKADISDWAAGAATNSVWQFSINTTADATLIGQNSNSNLTPIVTNAAASALSTIIKQPLTFNPVTSTPAGKNFASVIAEGMRNTQEKVGIFNAISPSTTLLLNSITLSQAGTALPTGTSSAVSYYVYDSLIGYSQPVGIGTLSGSGSVTINLSLNSALNKGVNVPTDGSEYLVIAADTTNFSLCYPGNNCTAYGYSLSLSGWQYSDPAAPGVISTGPFAPDIAKTAVYPGGVGRSY